jgi:multisubunit Na+/H+ antiporter MnhB subunit
VKRFKFRIASGAILLVIGLLFAVGHGAAGLAMLALALIAVVVVAFKVL